MVTATPGRDWWDGKVIDGMPLADYLRDPVPGGSLSSSGARLLISPHCPAKYRWAQSHPKIPKVEFDIGSAAHNLLLGTGPDIVVIHEETYHKKDARNQRDTAHKAGEVPLLDHQMDMVNDMVHVARDHPILGPLVEPGTGRPEQTLSWRDPATGIMCRARLDWLSDRDTTDGRRIILDYKTCKSAHPDKAIKAIRDYRYHMQGAFYIDAVIGCGIAKDAVFLLAFQETEPPFLITVMELHPVTGLWVGRELNDHARRVYAECVKTDRWPGYADDITTADLPDWEIRDMERIIGADPIKGVT